MTETEWLGCNDPDEILFWLKDRSSDRKMRLFGLACCQRIAHLFPDRRSKSALVILEHYADGQCSNDELRSACEAANEAYLEREVGQSEYNMADTALEALLHTGLGIFRAADYAASALAEDRLDLTTDWNTLRAAERKYQCKLLREVIGNPFHPVTVDPSWLTSTVLILAQGIYQEKAFDRMPILGDALQEAGCTNADLLNHCRQPGEHVRGCWAVDLLLGKR
jgi:hypothetical protein